MLRCIIVISRSEKCVWWLITAVVQSLMRQSVRQVKTAANVTSELQRLATGSCCQYHLPCSSVVAVPNLTVIRLDSRQQDSRAALKTSFTMEKLVCFFTACNLVYLD